mgnify:CR=1
MNAAGQLRAVPLLQLLTGTVLQMLCNKTFQYHLQVAWQLRAACQLRLRSQDHHKMVWTSPTRAS